MTGCVERVCYEGALIMDMEGVQEVMRESCSCGFGSRASLKICTLTMIESASQNPHPWIFSSLNDFCGPLVGVRRYNRVTTKAADPRPEKANRCTTHPFNACTYCHQGVITARDRLIWYL